MMLRSLRVVLLSFVTGVVAAPIVHASKPPEAAAEHPVLRVARSFSDGGAYNDKWAGSGTPEEIRFDGARILPKGEGGTTYCSGFTFAVVMRAATDAGLLKGKSSAEVRAFQKAWYGAVKDPDVRERQCAVAVEQLGIGKSVAKVEDARPGDFAQLWRTTKTGHSVVVVELIRDHGAVVGLRYRSSQKSTKGIGDNVEYFADVAGKNGKLLRERTFVCRLNEK